MELTDFLQQLKSALLERGMPPDVVKKHLEILLRNFKEEDMADIQKIRDPSEIAEVADSVVAMYRSHHASRTANENPPAPDTPAPLETIVPEPLEKETENTALADDIAVSPVEEEKEEAGATFARPQQSHNKPVERTPSPVPRPVRPQNHSDGRHALAPRRHTSSPRGRAPGSVQPAPRAQHSDDFFTEGTSADKTTRGVATFWIGFFLLLPLTLAVILGILSLFTAAFVVLVVLIIGLILAMIGIIAAGVGVSLIGIIYGITQLFSFPAAGVYEIGLGVCVIGIVLFSGVSLYNLAIRFLPWVIHWLAVFFQYVYHQGKMLFYTIRRECYKL